jgi:hypothetical protein
MSSENAKRQLKQIDISPDGVVQFLFLDSRMINSM